MDVWSRWERRLGGDVGVTWGGELRWTASEDGASELREEVGLMQSWDYPIRLISPEELAEMEPGLVADPVTTASFGNAEGHIDTTAVISRAFAHATERGVELVTDTPVKGLSVEIADGATRVTGVETQNGHLPADMVVLAAGYSTQQLAPDIGLNFPQIERPGVTILTPPMAPIFQTVACVHTPKDLPDPQMNFRQIHGGTHFGSVENETAVR